MTFLAITTDWIVDWITLHRTEAIAEVWANDIQSGQREGRPGGRKKFLFQLQSTVSQQQKL